MNASSTHDTKRSEDVRARILVLSEMPDLWDHAVERWAVITEGHRRDIGGRLFPEINEQLMIYQTLLGVWPLHESEHAALPDRLHGFLQKAAREAKTHSSWLDPNEEYEKALYDYTDALLADKRFLEDFAPLRDTVAWYGALNSLSQLTIKLCAPGVPDIYQGNEAWSYDLVDPDNRRPVDFEALAKRLRSLPANITASAASRMLHDWKDGRIKMHVTHTGTHLRRAKPHLFANGEYIGLRKHGKHARNVIPFMRHFGDEWLLVLTGRFYSQLGPRPVGNAWADTAVELPAGAPREWRNILTDGTSMEEVFATLPFAILTCV
jgi:(1->4)-alpha-D-glucan 1-alpha-D-glucosylmutase